MKSDTIKITRNEDNLNQILCETQKTAEYANLNVKQTIRTRLIAEEFVDMLKECEVVIINRASPTLETSQMKKNVKLINNKVSVLALDHAGNKLSLESDLPYDVNAPVISVNLQDFGDFYLDTLENKVTIKTTFPLILIIKTLYNINLNIF